MSRKVKSIAVENRIKSMTLFSDTLSHAYFDGNIEATQHVLRIFLNKEDLNVTHVQTQYAIDIPGIHKVSLDVQAVDGNNEIYDIEIQQGCESDLIERAIFYGALMTAKCFEKGKHYKDLPHIYVIFVCKTGCFCHHRPFYRYLVRGDDGNDTGKGPRIYFINGRYRNHDKLGILMHDFNCANPEEMSDPVIANRVKQIKCGKEEIRKMDSYEKRLYASAEAIGEARGKAIGEARGKAIGEAKRSAEIARLMLDLGEDIDKIALITKIPKNEICKMKYDDLSSGDENGQL